MSEILNPVSIDPKEQEFDPLFHSMGWWNLNETDATEKLKGSLPHTFILICSDSPYEDLLLVFVNSKGNIMAKPIHIMGKSPSWRFMNGINRLHSNLKSLLIQMMDCNLEDLNPLIDPNHSV